MAEQSFKLNRAASRAVSDLADLTGLSEAKVLGAAVTQLKQASPDAVTAASQAGEEAEVVTGRDYIRIAIIVVLVLLLMASLVAAFWGAAPRHLSLDEATKICSASNTATGAKTCDPSKLIDAHDTNLQARLLALLGVLFTPILALFSGSVGYYFGKSTSVADTVSENR